MSMDLYAQNILEHYKNPQNFGELLSPTVSQREVNQSCGDVLELDLLIENDTLFCHPDRARRGGRVEGSLLTDLKFRGQGCAISQAAMSILSAEIIKKPLAEIEKITPAEVIAMLGIEISNRRSRCALLPLITLKNCLRKFANLPPLKWTDLPLT